MSKEYMLLTEVDNAQYFVTDFNEYGEEIEATLPENVRVFTELSENDFKQGMRNTYGISL